MGAVILFLVVLLLTSASSEAQSNAALEGRVFDPSGRAVPGATITVRSPSTAFELSVTCDAHGRYYVAAIPAGVYMVIAGASGFRSEVLEDLTFNVGLTLFRDFHLELGSQNETVVVRAPLVDATSLGVGGNVDRRQMEQLPLSGRNWMELALQVKGVTGNDADNRPGVSADSAFQLNLDGQQVTNEASVSNFFGQPRFSREAIAEFQVVSNLFDITEGRSTGMQVRAVSRSGANHLSGSLYGYLRDRRLNAKDPVAGRVLPYQNQQVGGALGGPIVRDKWLYFGSYEYEREPGTVFFQPINLPDQSFEYANRQKTHSALARVDHNLSEASRLSYRYSVWNFDRPVDKQGEHPTQAATLTRHADNVLLSWSHVRSAASVEELKVGYNTYGWRNGLAIAEMATVPTYNFLGGAIGGISSFPQRFTQRMVTARYDASLTRGTHHLKAGGEFLGWKTTGEWRLVERGLYNFRQNPPDLERRFPEASVDRPEHWDVSGLDAYATNFLQNNGDWTIDVPRPTYAIWLGDTWRVHDRLTVNLGVRYDLDRGATSPPGVVHRTDFAPFGGPLYKTNVSDNDNVAPRGWFAWRALGTDDFVVRGGSGLYYGTIVSNVAFLEQSYNRIIVNSFANDGRPGWFEAPTRGFTPEQIQSGAVPQAPTVIAHDFEFPVRWQSAIGFQKQLSPTLVWDLDLVHWKEDHRPRGRDINLVRDPATGYPTPVLVADPQWGPIVWLESKARADSLALTGALNRRFADAFQAGVAYTHMFYARDNQPAHNFAVSADNPVSVDDPSEWARSREFQRHTLRMNGIWLMGKSVTVAAVYYFGSGNYFDTSVAGNPYGKSRAWSAVTNRLYLGPTVAVGGVAGNRYEGPSVLNNGDRVPRNALKGDALSKLDVRLAKSLQMAGVDVEGSVEVFNLFNHDNYGSYNAVVTSPQFGAPNQNLGSMYRPRTGQLAIRVSF